MPLSRYDPDLLYQAVAGKPYYDMTFRDIAAWWILGGSCLGCTHAGPVNRGRILRRWGEAEQLRVVDDYLACKVCGNRQGNRFTIVGKLPR